MASRRASRRSALAAAAAVLLASAAPGDALAREDGGVDIDVRRIDRFEVGSDRTIFGAFEFIGGLEFTSASGLLGGMSAIRFIDDSERFIGVMDTGRWYTGRLRRDEDGVPAGFDAFAVDDMRSAAGVVDEHKWLVDAEGLAHDGDSAFVSYERSHRIERFSLDDMPGGAARETIDFVIPEAELRHNRGMEALAGSPDNSPLEGSLVVVTERSINQAGDIFAAVVSGPREGVFFVRRDPPFDVTDGDFLPNGDLLLLERRFDLVSGVGMRIRRIEGETIAPGETVDGDVLLEADFDYQIDNMEGLDVFTTAGGEIHIVLVSDDNHSLLQRNLLLEFRLVD